jgi:hypothetical protein
MCVDRLINLTAYKTDFPTNRKLSGEFSRRHKVTTRKPAAHVTKSNKKTKDMSHSLPCTSNSETCTPAAPRGVFIQRHGWENKRPAGTCKHPYGMLFMMIRFYAILDNALTLGAAR